jgi:hypothetical protein
MAGQVSLRSLPKVGREPGHDDENAAALERSVQTG